MAENYFGITDTGRMRDNNEDNFIAQAVKKDRFILACVIDGVGGYEGGEVAAEIAKQSILDEVSVAGSASAQLLKGAMVAANQEIYQAKQEGNHPNMACVATASLVDLKENKCYYAHVGDTRMYLFRDQSLVKITRDQSFVGFLEDSGRLTEDEAMSHPKRNEINKALGFDNTIGSQEDYIDVGESPFLPGDMLLLCSDGLSDLVPVKSIIGILNNYKDLPAKAKALVAAANDAGGKDNITVVLVQNAKPQAKQKATKPVLVKKNKTPQLIESKTEANVNPTVNKTKPKTSANKTFLITVLVLLTLVSLATSFYLFREHFIKGDEDPVAKSNTITEIPRNRNEVMLQDSISQSPNDTLFIRPANFGDTIRLTQTIFVNRDSFTIMGPVVLMKDSNFNKGGPAIALSENSRQVIFNNIEFSGFDIAIFSRDPSSIKLKDLRFNGTQVFLAFGSSDSSYQINEFPRVKVDSLNKWIHEERR